MSRSSKRTAGRSGAGGGDSFSTSKTSGKGLDEFDERGEREDRWAANDDDVDPSEFDRPLADDPHDRKARRSLRSSTSSTDGGKKKKAGTKKSSSKRQGATLLSAEDPNPVIGLEGAPLLLFSASHEETVSPLLPQGPHRRPYSPPSV